MTTTLELHVRKIQWFCQQGEGFCMHVFSSLILSGNTFCMVDNRLKQIVYNSDVRVMSWVAVYNRRT